MDEIAKAAIAYVKSLELPHAVQVKNLKKLKALVLPDTLPPR